MFQDFGAELVVAQAAAAVEKMLKAGLLMSKGSVERGSNLRHLAGLLVRYGAAEEALGTAVEEMLWRCDLDASRLRYPDLLPHPLIPHCHYTTAQRRLALQKMDAVFAILNKAFTF